MIALREELTRGANPEQMAVIEHLDGPCQVPAVAGCGKSFAVVRRAGALIERGVDPERIALLTFSSGGAKELDARTRHLGIAGVTCKTWHALCLSILRDADHVAIADKWTIDDKDKAKGLIKKTLGYQELNWKGADLARVRKFVAHCKANAFEFGEPDAIALAQKRFGREAMLALKAWQRSQELIEEAKLLTFDDMLVFAHRLLRDDEEIRGRWARRFDYVITDEAQDNSRIQKELQAFLALISRNLMVVGDPAQAIYSFRGSSPEYLVEFVDLWQAKRIVMYRNYRCGRAIVAAANAIIRPAQVRLPEEMVAERDVEGKVEIVAAHDLDDEASEFVEFARRHQEGGGSLSDITVLFRLNAQSRALEDAMLRAKLPYVMIGGTNFYERKEVKDLLGYLRVAFDRDPDRDGVRRCINAPFRFLGTKFVERVMAVADETPKTDPETYWPDVVTRAAVDVSRSVQARQAASAAEWCTIIATLQTSKGGPYELLDQVVRQTGYIGWLEKEEGAEDSVDQSHGANVRELLRVAQSFKTVAEFLDYVDANIKESGRQKRGKRENSITLMTIHRSKGLEWPIVWVVGCNEGVFPFPKGDPEEERRLMYVAATRARDHLVFSHVAEMAMRSGVRSVERSSFLEGVLPPKEPDFPFVDPEEAEELEIGEAPEARNPGSESREMGPIERRLGPGNCLECSQPLDQCTCPPRTVTWSDRA